MLSSAGPRLPRCWALNMPCRNRLRAGLLLEVTAGLGAAPQLLAVSCLHLPSNLAVPRVCLFVFKWKLCLTQNSLSKKRCGQKGISSVPWMNGWSQGKVTWGWDEGRGRLLTQPLLYQLQNASPCYEIAPHDSSSCIQPLERGSWVLFLAMEQSLQCNYQQHRSGFHSILQLSGIITFSPATREEHAPQQLCALGNHMQRAIFFM